VGARVQGELWWRQSDQPFQRCFFCISIFLLFLLKTIVFEYKQTQHSRKEEEEADYSRETKNFSYS
jgi:hypothetical protein